MPGATCLVRHVVCRAEGLRRGFDHNPPRAWALPVHKQRMRGIWAADPARNARWGAATHPTGSPRPRGRRMTQPARGTPAPWPGPRCCGQERPRAPAGSAVQPRAWALRRRGRGDGGPAWRPGWRPAPPLPRPGCVAGPPLAKGGRRLAVSFRGWACECRPWGQNRRMPFP